MIEKVDAHEGQEQITANAEKSLVAAPTSHMVTPGMHGLEELDREDLSLGRVKLLQAMSDEVANGEGVAGEWHNTLSGESYEGSFEFVPISVWKSRTIFAEDRNESPVCQSPDGRTSVDGKFCAECPHRQWVDGNPPECAEGYNYLVIPGNEGFPSIVTLMKSSFKTGKALNTLLMAARCPAWFWVYELYSVKQTNARGSFYVAAVRKKVVEGKPIASDEMTQQQAEAFYSMAKAGRISVADAEDKRKGEDNATNNITEANVELATAAEEEAADEVVPF